VWTGERLQRNALDSEHRNDLDDEHTVPNLNTLAVPRWMSERRSPPRMIPAQGDTSFPVTLVLTGPGLPCDMGVRLSPQTRIGRAPESELCWSWDTGVSRRHCRFVYSANKVFLEDLGSKHGTYVDGHKVGVHEIQGGEEIQVGHTRFTVVVLRSPLG
jgi:pSer/pThr/pTyr-binding forkhead associated (FHA) protein